MEKDRDALRSERFVEVITKLSLSNSELENSLRINKDLKSKIFKGKQNASIEKISLLCEEYNNVNADYILTGRGEPLNKTTEEAPDIPTSSGTAITTEDEYQDAQQKGLHLLPQVSFKFSAGQTQLLNITEDITRYWYLPDCKDCEGVAQVVGRSMSPTLPSGCWVALKRYTLPNNNPNTIPFGNIFGVVVEDEVTGEYHGHIKVLRRYKEQELSRQYWIAHSINSDEFDDFDIEIKQVKSLWIVKQHIVSDILL